MVSVWSATFHREVSVRPASVVSVWPATKTGVGSKITTPFSTDVVPHAHGQHLDERKRTLRHPGAHLRLRLSYGGRTGSLATPLTFIHGIGCILLLNNRSIRWFVDKPWHCDQNVNAFWETLSNFFPTGTSLGTVSNSSTDLVSSLKTWYFKL